MLSCYHLIGKGEIKIMATLFVRDFPEDLHKAAKMKALEEDLTLKELIIRAVEAYLKAKKGGK